MLMCGVVVKDDMDGPVFGGLGFLITLRKPMPDATRKANARKSMVRSKVEHVFAAQKHRMGLFIRTIGMERAKTKIAMANMVYNMQRLVWLNARGAPG